MPKPSVLVLESDPSCEEQLNGVLSTAGYDVYSASRVDALISALKRSAFAVVIVDLTQNGVEPSALASEVLQIRPHLRLIFSGPEVPFDRLLALFRAGASDYFVRPYDAVEVVARVRDNVQRLSSLRRNKTSDPPTVQRETDDIGGVDRPQVVAFARKALQTVLDLQQQSAEMQRKVSASDPRISERLQRPLTTWIVHADRGFVDPMVTLAPRIELDVTAVLATGGEVLDRLGTVRPQLLLLGDSLPDIPAEMVLETVASQAADVHILLVEGWETGNRVGTLRSGAGDAPVQRTLRSVDDLLGLIRIAAERAREAVFGREVAEEFRTRHGDFLRRYAELMATCGERP
jgi:DNA-binding response OmpR family regulator